MVFERTRLAYLDEQPLPSGEAEIFPNYVFRLRSGFHLSALKRSNSTCCGKAQKVKLLGNCSWCGQIALYIEGSTTGSLASRRENARTLIGYRPRNNGQFSSLHSPKVHFRKEVFHVDSLARQSSRSYRGADRKRRYSVSVSGNVTLRTTRGSTAFCRM